MGEFTVNHVFYEACRAHVAKKYAEAAWKLALERLGPMEGDMANERWVRVDETTPAESWRGAVVKVRDEGGVPMTVGSPGCVAGVYLGHVAPWVPRVGERVFGHVTSGVDIEGTCKSVETVGANTYVRWHEYPQHALSVTTCAPVLNDSGRPVMEAGWSFAPKDRGIHYPDGTTLRMVTSTGPTITADDLAEWNGEISHPAYQPRVGDRVRFFGTECDVERVGDDNVIDVRGVDGGGAQRTFPDHVTPLRPTAVGQRVRWAGSEVRDHEAEAKPGIVTTVYDRFAVGVRWEGGVEHLYTAAVLVRIADRDVKPENVTRVRAEVETTFAPGSVTWTPMPHPAPIGYTLAEPEPPPCGRRDHAVRPKGTTCVHFWPCGCAVEPEGEDALGTVNGEARGVIVWGHGGIGDGFTRDEALADWRVSVGHSQRGLDICATDEPCPGRADNFDVAAHIAGRIAAQRKGEAAVLRIVRESFAARKALAMDASKVRGPEAVFDAVAASCAMLTALATRDAEAFEIARADHARACESMPPNTGESKRMKRARRS